MLARATNGLVRVMASGMNEGVEARNRRAGVQADKERWIDLSEEAATPAPTMRCP